MNNSIQEIEGQRGIDQEIIMDEPKPTPKADIQTAMLNQPSGVTIEHHLS